MKSQKRKKPKAHYCEVYKANVHFYIGWNGQEFEKAFQKNYGTSADTAGKRGSMEALHCAKGMIIVVWTEKRNDGPALAHECVHAANQILHSRGWKPDLENDEPQAYLVDSLFKAALE